MFPAQVDLVEEFRYVFNQTAGEVPLFRYILPIEYLPFYVLTECVRDNAISIAFTQNSLEDVFLFLSIKAVCVCFEVKIFHSSLLLG